MDLIGIEVVEDRTAQSTCDQGFLTLQRLLVRNRYADGSFSESYPCDVLRRRGSDAVVAVLYELGADGSPKVLLREASRVPIYLRRQQRFVHPDPKEYLSLLEVVAGMVESSDASGQPGLAARAAAEALEEAGAEIAPEAFAPLGGETFASPGTGDEKLYFQGAATPLALASGGAGDGSVMEEWGKLCILELRGAIQACREGSIPDMKTEVALLRLADHLGYIPQLDCFVRDLPPALSAKYTSLGIEVRPEA